MMLFVKEQLDFNRVCTYFQVIALYDSQILICFQMKMLFAPKINI